MGVWLASYRGEFARRFWQLPPFPGSAPDNDNFPVKVMSGFS